MSKGIILSPFARNNNEEFIAELKRVFKPFYEDAIKRNYEKFYILYGGMPLEDCLIKDNIYLKSELI